MDGWVKRAGKLLLPLLAAIKRKLLAGSYLQADETLVAMQVHPGTYHQAYLWQYGRPRASRAFDFQMDRGQSLHYSTR